MADGVYRAEPVYDSIVRPLDSATEQNWRCSDCGNLYGDPDICVSHIIAEHCQKYSLAETRKLAKEQLPKNEKVYIYHGSPWNTNSCGCCDYNHTRAVEVTKHYRAQHFKWPGKAECPHCQRFWTCNQALYTLHRKNLCLKRVGRKASDFSPVGEPHSEQIVPREEDPRRFHHHTLPQFSDPQARGDERVQVLTGPNRPFDRTAFATVQAQKRGLSPEARDGGSRPRIFAKW